MLSKFEVSCLAILYTSSKQYTFPIYDGGWNSTVDLGRELSCNNARSHSLKNKTNKRRRLQGGKKVSCRAGTIIALLWVLLTPPWRNQEFQCGMVDGQMVGYSFQTSLSCLNPTSYPNSKESPIPSCVLSKQDSFCTNATITFILYVNDLPLNIQSTTDYMLTTPQSLFWKKL